jgi:hypothetical protein
MSSNALRLNVPRPVEEEVQHGLFVLPVVVGVSWALGCEHADVVASIAPAEEINRVSDCWKGSKLPARELPILFAYGRRDSIGGGYQAAQQLAQDVARAWKMQGPESLAGTESAKYFRQRWSGPSGNVLEFIDGPISTTDEPGGSEHVSNNPDDSSTATV